MDTLAVTSITNFALAAEMIAGIVVLLAASVIQASDMDVPGPLDSDGLYHQVSMIGVPFLYRGGQRLRTG